MTNAPSTTMAIIPSSCLEAAQPRADKTSLSRPARSLSEAARAFRDASDAQHDPEDLAVAFALVGAALDDLAAGAELSAYATMEGSRRRRAGATNGLPLATARALSWRLHGLQRGLVGARRICSELTRVLEAATRR
jgi:hypothetical protein